MNFMIVFSSTLGSPCLYVDSGSIKNVDTRTVVNFLRSTYSSKSKNKSACWQFFLYHFICDDISIVLVFVVVHFLFLFAKISAMETFLIFNVGGSHKELRKYFLLQPRKIFSQLASFLSFFLSFSVFCFYFCSLPSKLWRKCCVVLFKTLLWVGAIFSLRRITFHFLQGSSCFVGRTTKPFHHAIRIQ